MTTTTGQAPDGLVPVSWPALGTTAVLMSTGDAPAAREAAEREIRAIDAAASRFDPTSELSRLNRAAGQVMNISLTLLEALQLAVRAAALTDGAVDPTLGDRLVALGYDRDFGELERVAPDTPLAMPDDSADPRTQRWRAIELWTHPPAARLGPSMLLDLGATAKALAADRGARAAADAADGGVLLALGGDIATSGDAPETGWTVRVTDDHRDSTGSGQHLTLRSGGLATSSLIARRWRRAGQVFHHVLDPRTGAPVTPVWRTVSVAAASCADANIASTAALVLGARAPAWMGARGLPARLVAVDGSVRAQGGWPQ
ncbi:MAG TPA: FAD:protein FMN transferase [Solirubrobacteraceae bacterium]